MGHEHDIKFLRCMDIDVQALRVLKAMYDTESRYH